MFTCIFKFFYGHLNFFNLSMFNYIFKQNNVHLHVLIYFVLIHLNKNIMFTCILKMNLHITCILKMNLRITCISKFESYEYLSFL